MSDRKLVGSFILGAGLTLLSTLVSRLSVNFALVTTALLIFLGFLLLGHETIMKRVFCARCRGRGKEKCTCNDGWISPLKGPSGCSTPGLERTPDGKYIYRLSRISGGNIGVSGTATLKASVTSRNTGALLGENSKEIPLRGFTNESFEEAIDVNLGDLSSLEELLDREVTNEDVWANWDLYDYKPPTKCPKCKGKGFVVCPGCGGKRVRW